jgi:hypothetical protein
MSVTNIVAAGPSRAAPNSTALEESSRIELKRGDPIKQSFVLTM